MIKVLFSDLDGTMLSKNHDGTEVFVDKHHQQLLHQLISQGVKVVSVSGREVEFTQNYLNQQLGFNFDAIGSNGATITYQQQLVSYYPCQKSHLIEICEFLRHVEDINPFILEHDGTITMLHNDRFPFNEFREAVKHGNIAKVEEEISLMEKLQDPNIPDPPKMCISTANYSQTKQWVQALNYQFSEYFDVFNSALRYIEVVAKGVNKGSGVMELCRLMNVELDEIAVVGDAENDISMLTLTPHSFAMAHGQSMVQEHAKHLAHDYSEVVQYILDHNKVS
jgi:Cof subfamily protein (haloacid dehalogenase superfamily)